MDTRDGGGSMSLLMSPAVAAPYEEAGRSLRLARVRASMSQQFLGILLGATQQTVSRWEQGLGAPGRSAQGSLCSVLGLPRDLWSLRARHPLAG